MYIGKQQIIRMELTCVSNNKYRVALSLSDGANIMLACDKAKYDFITRELNIGNTVEVSLSKVK